MLTILGSLGCVPLYRDVSWGRGYKQYVGTTAVLNTELDLSLNRNKYSYTDTHYSQYTFSKWSGSNPLDPDKYFVWREPIAKGTKIKILAFKRGNDQDHVIMELFSHKENRMVEVQDTFGLSGVEPFDVKKELQYLTFPN